MNKKLLAFLIILTAVSIIAIAQTAGRVILINNTPMDVSRIDSISFDTGANPPQQKIWYDGKATAFPLNNGAASPILTGMDLSRYIYRITNPSEVWDLMYVTPAGYFFRGNASTIADEEDSAVGKMWFYQSFDGLSHATIRMDHTGDIARTVSMDYDTGIAEYSRSDNDIVIIHITEDYDKESLRAHGYDAPNHDIADDELKSSLYHHVRYYDGYDFDMWESDLQKHIDSFRNLLLLPVIMTDATAATKATAAKAGIKVKKLHDRNFAVVPFTGKVHDNEIYDCSVRNAYGRISVASPTFLKEAEYGLLLDTDPKRLECGTASVEVKLSQPRIMSSFSAYFNGLTSGTKYYYRTYCKIPKSRLDTYHFRYGDKKATTGYGRVKDFTTKTAVLVNVEVHNEGRRMFDNCETLAIPVSVYNIEYTWNSADNKDEYVWSFMGSDIGIEGYDFFLDDRYIGDNSYHRECDWFGFTDFTLSGSPNYVYKPAYHIGCRAYPRNGDINLSFHSHSSISEVGEKHEIGTAKYWFHSSESVHLEYNFYFNLTGDRQWHTTEEYDNYRVYYEYYVGLNKFSSQGSIGYYLTDNEIISLMKEGSGKNVKYENVNGYITTEAGYGYAVYYKYGKYSKENEPGTVPEHIQNLPKTMKVRTVFKGECNRPALVDKANDATKQAGGQGSGVSPF